MNAIIKDGEKGTRIVPQRINILLTGCCEIFKTADGRACATYEDGTREYARLELPAGSFLSQVSAIQALRPNTIQIAEAKEYPRPDDQGAL